MGIYEDGDTYAQEDLNKFFANEATSVDTTLLHGELCVVADQD